MRRTFTLLLLLLLCFAPAAYSQLGNPAATVETEPARQNLIDALKRLQTASTKEQAKPDAQKLQDDVKRKLAGDFRSDEQLSAVIKSIPAWKESADKLTLKGPLYTEVTGVYEANNEYQKALNSTEDGGGQTTPPPPSSAPAPTPFPKTTSELSDFVASEVSNSNDARDSSLGSRLMLFSALASPLLAIGLFAVALMSLGKTRDDVGEAGKRNSQTLEGVKSRQEALAKQVESLKASNSDLFARLAELSAELGSVSRRVEQGDASSSANNNSAAPHASMATVGGGAAVAESQPEPPAFPITADAYLRKMQRFATVVKPDFQNGILVADAENKGELVLVRDATVSHDTLFLIPRATQFQMKQDFYTYYERYYDCERPASGMVWILDPAVVERVADGWMLREKGVLEVH